MLNFYKLEQRIEQGMQKGHVPGLALAIVKDQEVIYARGFGVTSIEDGGVPVTPQTLFRIGSTTKPMTGTAILLPCPPLPNILAGATGKGWRHLCGKGYLAFH